MRIEREPWFAYKLRWRRRKLLFRAIRMRHQLKPTKNRTEQIRPGDILAVSTVRNEIIRLPHFLKHYRNLGVNHFLFVDNSSNDGTLDFLAEQPDVSVWTTSHSYKQSRYGVDWLTWLQMKYAHGHWCLALDADEIFIYPDWEQRDLTKLTCWLEDQGIFAMAAMMLDMYPKGPLSKASYAPKSDPIDTLSWFDCDNYTWEIQKKFRNISIRGGARKRKFFSDRPELAPDLNKIPLIKWHRSFAYANSTHVILPNRLNNALDARLDRPTGVLLHSKFLDVIVKKSCEEKIRGQHFAHIDRYDAYYDQIIADPDLWYKDSVRYTGWQQLIEMGLMAGGQWHDGAKGKK